MKKYFLISIFSLIFCNISYGEILKTQYVHDYAPLSFKLNGKATGIYYDIVSELNNELKSKNISIVSGNPEFVPIKRILKNLEENKIDLIVGITKTRKREKKFQYGQTLMLEPEMTFAKLISDNSDYSVISSLKGKNVCSLAGSNSAKSLSNIEGLGMMNNANSISKCLKLLAANRVDAVYFHHFALLYYIKENNLGNIIKLSEKSLKSKDYYMCFSQKVNPSLIAEIDKAAKSFINKGLMTKILDKYR